MDARRGRTAGRANFNTFLRYKYIDTHYPLYGVTHDVGYQIAYALNSNMPTQENRVELGGTWTPTDCLMFNATLYVENAYSNAPYAHAVDEQQRAFHRLSSLVVADARLVVHHRRGAEMDSWINQSVNLSNLNAANGPALDYAVAVYRRVRRVDPGHPLPGDRAS